MANLFLSKLKLNGSYWGPGPGQSRGYPIKTPNSGVGGKGWDNTIDNFDTIDDTAKALAPPIPLGEIRTLYTDNTNCPGYYSMIYLALHDFSDYDISGDFSDGNMWCCLADGSKTMHGDGSTGGPFTVSRCITGAIYGAGEPSASPLVIPCATLSPDSSLHSSITDPFVTGLGDSYGWFWCAGVCPCKDVTLMKGTADSLKGAEITVDGLMRKGPVVGCMTAATLELFSNDISNVQDDDASGGALGPVIGWSCISAE